MTVIVGQAPLGSCSALHSVSWGISTSALASQWAWLESQERSGHLVESCVGDLEC